MIEKCCICGNKVETKKILPYRDLIGSGVEIYNMHIARCDNCGFIFQQNPFTDEQLENRYKSESKFEFDSNSYIPNGEDNYAKRCKRQKNFIEENISGKPNGGGYESILEIGAASGYNLSLYSDKHRLGIEPSELNCKLAKKNYGVEMFNGMWSEFWASNTGKTFDLIFTSHVLEHIVNPMKFIQECASICNKYMLIEVPCFDIKFIDEPFGMFAEEHVNYFTIQSLSTIMNNTGFKMLNAELVFEPKNRTPNGFPAISSLWEKSPNVLPIYNSDSCLERYLRENEILLQEINKKINAIPYNEKLALWGIAHHVSMLLANTCLGNKNIVRMYDSDKRKTGFKIMGIPITPFDKADIESGAVDAILITTYTAQRSILRAIEKMNLNCKIYTLYDI